MRHIIIGLSSVLSFHAFPRTQCFLPISKTSIQNTIIGRGNHQLRHFFLSASSNEKNEAIQTEHNAVNSPNTNNNPNNSGWVDDIPKQVLEDIGSYGKGSSSSSSLFNLEMTTSDYYRSTRLVKGRSYARDTAFRKENLSDSPILSDLTSPDQKSSIEYDDTLWTTNGYRFGIFLSSFLAFPTIVQFLKFQETIPLSMVDELTDNFSTGISVLYGTLISLTLSILYSRQRCITEEISNESALLVILARNLLALFQNDKENIVLAAYCIADQVRILVKESRGKELMTIIYSDPYGRLLDLLTNTNSEQKNNNSELAGNTRDVIKECMMGRSKRLAGESSALPPTHFFILTLITGIILLSYTLSTLSSISDNGDPSFESRLFFALFVTVYVLFYNFATDLNNPFAGVYQIRRSSVAANLLQVKLLLINSPYLKDIIDFDERKKK